MASSEELRSKLVTLLARADLGTGSYKEMLQDAIPPVVTKTMVDSAKGILEGKDSAGTKYRMIKAELERKPVSSGKQPVPQATARRHFPVPAAKVLPVPMKQLPAGKSAGKC